AALPTTNTPLNTVVHVVLTFHFTVLSRVFFRAETFEGAKQMIAGLLAFDTQHLVRPGLLSPWLLLALIGGTAYHFTPKAWVEKHVLGLFRRTPGPILGLGFLALCYGLMKLLEGSPRAFIYFQY
ncbi:MAG: hypothetical protein ACPG77_14815, partial [Nannocystaceae bacterium]